MIQRERLAQVIAIILLAVVVINFFVFVFVKNPPWLFWTITIVAALLSYFVVPRIRGVK